MNFAQERRFGRTNVGQGLLRLRLGKEDDEIDRMAFPERNANLGFALEPADTAAVPGAGIDDDPRAAVVARRHRPFRRVNVHERVIDRAIELAAVDNHVVVEGEDRPETFFFARDAGIAALAQRIQVEYPALPEVLDVFGERITHFRNHELRHQLLQRHPCGARRIDLAATDGFAVMETQMAQQRQLLARVCRELLRYLQVSVLILRKCVGDDHASAHDVIAAVDVVNAASDVRRLGAGQERGIGADIIDACETRGRNRRRLSPRWQCRSPALSYPSEKTPSASRA